MSFDEGNLLGEQSDPVDTLTSTSDAGNSSRKSAGSNILFQAYFLPGESAQSQGSEDATNSRVQPSESVSWTNQSNAPSTGAGSQGWSSFSDISNQISPAQSCDDCDDSVNVSWRESETESDLLTSQGNTETGCTLSVPLSLVSTAVYQFGPTTTCVQQNVTTQSSKGDRLGYTEPDGGYTELSPGYSELKGNNNEFVVSNQLEPDDLVNPPVLEPVTATLGQTTRSAAETLSNECFEAAIKEKLKSDLRGKIITKLSQSKTERRCQRSYTSVKKQHDHHHHQQHQNQDNQHQLQSFQTEHVSSTQICSSSLSHDQSCDIPHDIPHDLPHDLNSQVLPNQPDLSAPTFVHSSVHCVSSSSVSVYVAPESPSVTSPSSGEQSDTSSQKSYSKKYRYNQTAAALQKSGLFNSTMKTAELLQRNKVLQQELQKLKRETMIFVSSVLANPENAHLRKMYMHKNQGTVVRS